jgi:hypothetical protein
MRRRSGWRCNRHVSARGVTGSEEGSEEEGGGGGRRRIRFRAYGSSRGDRRRVKRNPIARFILIDVVSEWKAVRCRQGLCTCGHVYVRRSTRAETPEDKVAFDSPLAALFRISCPDPVARRVQVPRTRRYLRALIYRAMEAMEAMAALALFIPGDDTSSKGRRGVRRPPPASPSRSLVIFLISRAASAGVHR